MKLPFITCHFVIANLSNFNVNNLSFFWLLATCRKLSARNIYFFFCRNLSLFCALATYPFFSRVTYPFFFVHNLSNFEISSHAGNRRLRGYELINFFQHSQHIDFLISPQMCTILEYDGLSVHKMHFADLFTH